MTLSVGIHAGVPMSDYLLHHGLSASRIHTMLQYSPFHAYHDAGGEPSEASEIGTAIHDALLEGVDRIAIIEADDWRTKAAKDARDAARAEGKIPMLARKVAQVMHAVDAAESFVAKSEIAGVFERGKAEQVFLWDDDGLLCKGRADWLSDKWHISLKTTGGSANPKAYTRFTMSQQGHDTGLAFYKRGLDALGHRVEHRILVVEQKAPFGCCVFGLAPSKRDYAERKLERAVSTWRHCKATGIYPAYPTETCFAEALPWEMAESEEYELESAFDALQDRDGLQA